MSGASFTRILSVVVTATVVFAGGLTGAWAAEAPPETGIDLTEVGDVAHFAQQVAPPSTGELSAVTREGSTLVAATGEGVVTLPLDPDVGAVRIGSESDWRALEVTLPPEVDTAIGAVAGNGLTVYPAETRDDAALTVESFTDGSVRIQAQIPSADAAHEFTYGLSVPAGGRLTVDAEGAAAVLDAEGRYVAGANRPWARDAAGSEVDTRYEVRGDALVQIVEPGPHAAYPIPADPWFGLWLVNSVTAVRVAQGVVYQVNPTLFGRAAQQYQYGTVFGDAVRKGLPPLKKFYDQLICHPASGIARVKGTWNIDSWRPGVGWWRTILTGCNP